VQTTGSAGESIAFGVGVTMPALMLLASKWTFGRVNGRRRARRIARHPDDDSAPAGVHRQATRHAEYPEGTACAEVLIVGEKGARPRGPSFSASAWHSFYQFLWQGMKLWKEVSSKSLSWFKGAVPAIEVNPALIGVGYIIGNANLVASKWSPADFCRRFVLIPRFAFLEMDWPNRSIRRPPLSKNMGRRGDLEKLCPLYRRRCRGGGWHHQSFSGFAPNFRLNQRGTERPNFDSRRRQQIRANRSRPAAVARRRRSARNRRIGLGDAAASMKRSIGFPI